MSELHERVLDGDTARVFERLGSMSELASFYLAGGTGAALQLGHRRSLDLDLFTERPWTWARVAPALGAVGEVVVDLTEPDTFVGTVSGVRVSLFHYPYALLEEPIPTRFDIPLAGLLDIGCMKLLAVGQRGSRKDFIDLYHLGLAGYPVRDFLDALPRKAPGTGFNPVHILRSLSYFEDAEQEPDPVMLVDYEWGAVRSDCEAQADALLDEILSDTQ